MSDLTGRATRDGRAFLWILGLTVVWFPTFGALRLSGLEAHQATVVADMITALEFIVLYIPRELDRPLRAAIFARLLAILRIPRVRRIAGGIVALAGAATLTALVATSVTNVPALLIALTVALATALFPRAILVPTQMIQLRRSLFFPYKALLAILVILILPLSAITAASVLMILATFLTVWGIGFNVADLILTSYVRRSTWSLELFVAGLSSQPAPQRGRRGAVKSMSGLHVLEHALAAGDDARARSLLAELQRSQAIDATTLEKLEVRLLYGERHFSEALNRIAAARRRGIDTKTFHTLEALSYIRLGKFDLASDAITRARSIDGSNPHFILADALYCWYLQAARNDPETLDLAIDRAGEAATRLQGAVQSVQSRHALLRAKNNLAYFLCHRLLLRNALGKTPEDNERTLNQAEMLAREARDLADTRVTRAVVNDTAGLISMLRGRLDVAFLWIRRSLGAVPTPAARNHLAVLRAIQGVSLGMVGAEYLLETNRYIGREEAYRCDPEIEYARRQLGLLRRLGGTGARLSRLYVFFQVCQPDSVPGRVILGEPRTASEKGETEGGLSEWQFMREAVLGPARVVGGRRQLETMELVEDAEGELLNPGLVRSS